MILLLPLLLHLLLLARPAPAQEQQILAHYMPWYAANAEQKTFGWHWTMDHFDPGNVDADGKREIASHYHPQIGPYDSGDPHVLEYHSLLMKISGIDGVVFDWYGSRDFRDYWMIDRNIRAMIPWLKRARLKFSFCYEDQTVKHMISEGQLKATEAVSETAFEFEKLADEFLEDDYWVTHDGKPVLLIFGPQHFEVDAWKQIKTRQATQGLPNPLLVFGLPHLADKFGLEGAFAWPPVVGGKEIPDELWKKRLGESYRRYEGQLIPVAFPGFHDIYSQAKLHDSHGFIDDRKGQTFRDSLSMARATEAGWVQIATWNDFGEGTMIEPTREFGYRYLETLIDADPRPRFSKEDLELPMRLYQLRRSGSAAAAAVSKALFEGHVEEARRLLRNQTSAATK